MITDYHVMVVVYATYTIHEGQGPDPEDFVGDDFIAYSRRQLVRETIENDPNYDERAEIMMKAFELSGIAVKDAARVLSAMTMLYDQKKGR